MSALIWTDVPVAETDHVHRFTEKCFVCNDQPTRCSICGECQQCGPRVSAAEIRADQDMVDREAGRRRYFGRRKR